MIAARGIDDGIGGARFTHQHIMVVEGAGDRRDPGCGECIGLRRIAHETGDLVPGSQQPLGHGPADETGRAGEEDVHLLLLLRLADMWIMEGRRSLWKNIGLSPLRFIIIRADLAAGSST